MYFVFAEFYLHVFIIADFLVLRIFIFVCILYLQNFAGLCGALMIGVGALGSVIAGIFVDKTKRFEEVVKVCWCLSCLFGVGFAQVRAV